MPGADEIRADGVAHAAGDLEQLVRGGAAPPRGDAGVDDAGVGTEGEHHARAEQRAHQLLERHGAKTEGADLDVRFALAGAAEAAQPGDDFILEHRAEFERGSGQHRKGGATAVEEDTGRGAAGIREALATLRHVTLREVRRSDLPADERETLAQGGLGRGHVTETDPEGGGDGLARVVVGSGPDAAGGHDQVVGAPPFADGAGDLGGVVAHDERTANGQSPAGQMLAEPKEMAVLAEPVQQLVPDVDDEDLAGRGFAGFHLRGEHVAAG